MGLFFLPVLLHGISSKVFVSMTVSNKSASSKYQVELIELDLVLQLDLMSAEIAAD